MPHFDLSSIPSDEKRSGVRCLSTNTDCLPNKIDEIEHFLKTENIDIAAINETIPKNITINELKKLKFEIPGYTLINKPEGRGICVYINENFEIIERFSEYEQLFSPCIFCKVKTTTNSTFILGVIYRSPNSTTQENKNILNLIETVSNKLINSGDKLLLVGDLNCPDIDWLNETCTKPPENFQSKFLDVIQQSYLSQFVDKDTHDRGLENERPTLIDLVFSNHPDFVYSLDLHDPFGKSHHSKICFMIDIEPLNNSIASTKIKYCMDKGDYVGMKEYMTHIKWDEILREEESVDVWWDVIEDTLNKAKDLFVPKKKLNPGLNKSKSKNSNNKKTYNHAFAAPESMLKKIKLKRYAFKTYKKYPTVKNYNIYARYRNQVIWETRKAKIQKEIKVAKDSKENPKAFFQYVNTKLKPKENISNLVKDDGTLTESDLEKCEILNNFFASVFSVEDINDVPTFTCANENYISTILVTESDMESALNNKQVTWSRWTTP